MFNHNLLIKNESSFIIVHNEHLITTLEKDKNKKGLSCKFLE